MSENSTLSGLTSAHVNSQGVLTLERAAIETLTADMDAKGYEVKNAKLKGGVAVGMESIQTGTLKVMGATEGVLAAFGKGGSIESVDDFKFEKSEAEGTRLRAPVLSVGKLGSDLDADRLVVQGVYCYDFLLLSITSCYC